MNTPLMLQVTPLRETADCQLHCTFQWAQIGWLNWQVATSEEEQEESRLREERTKEPNCNSDSVREQGHREKNTEKLCEEYLKEEHEVKMRIKKEGTAA